MTLRSENVIFVGYGQNAPAWYRTLLPAINLGCDWVSLDDDMAKPVAALSRSGVAPSPINPGYRLAVAQQFQSKKALDMIRLMHEMEMVVLYEIDDYIHGVVETSHQAAQFYTPERLALHDLCMAEADGLIVSTEFLAEKYGQINENVWVCRNALDIVRYEKFRRPGRTTINIGWAGGVGHDDAMKPWLEPVEQIMDEFPHVSFFTIGAPYAHLLASRFSDRAVAIPGVPPENFPAALTNFDIALAPAADTDFYRGKSDLRFLEAGAAKIPIIADRQHYGETIRHEYTGLLVDSHDQVFGALKTLIENAEFAALLGENAFEYVGQERDMAKECAQWEKSFTQSFDAAEV